MNHRLSYEDRITIEKMRLEGKKVICIAEEIGCHRATIYKELKRGGSPYNALAAQQARK